LLLLPFRQARTAMLVICVLLGLASVASLVCFGYQLNRLLATGGAYVPTTVTWPNVLGHLLRAGGLGLICWRLTKLVVSVDAETGEVSARFAARHRSLWKTAAWVLSVFAVYAAFETTYAWRRGPYEFFRPEFVSGYVVVEPGRIEFRRGSEEPIDGWSKMKVRDSEKEFFVSPTREITGGDIRRAVVRIAEIFPGNQSVELSIQFSDEGARKMDKLTRSHLRKPLAVLADGKLRAAPRVFSPISGDAQLTNVFTLQEAARMIEEGSDRKGDT
jgi:hypothetical protein